MLIKIRKCICITIAFIMCLTAFSTAGAAAAPNVQEIMKNRIGESFKEENFHIIGNVNGCSICTYFDKERFSLATARNIIAAEKLGDYLFTCPPCFYQVPEFADFYTGATRNEISYPDESGYYNDIGIFAIKGTKAFSLKEAYQNGLIDISQVAAMDYSSCGYDLTAENINNSDISTRGAICLRYCDEFREEIGPALFVFLDSRELFEGYSICHFEATSRDGFKIGSSFTQQCGYAMTSTNRPPYPPACFLVKGYNAYTFEEAYNGNIFENIDELAQRLGMVKVGDYNNDRTINLSDVLSMQKYLAKLIKAPNYFYYPDIILDFNQDSKVNLRDVFKLQKYLAKAK